MSYLCSCKVVITEPVEEQQKSEIKPEDGSSQEQPERDAAAQVVIPEVKEAPPQSETTETQEVSCSPAEKQSTKIQRAASKGSGASKLTRPKKAGVSEDNIETEEESGTKEIPQHQDDPDDADYTPSQFPLCTHFFVLTLTYHAYLTVYYSYRTPEGIS